MGCLLLKEALDLNSKLNFNIMNLQYTALMVMGFLGFRCPFFGIFHLWVSLVNIRLSKI